MAGSRISPRLSVLDIGAIVTGAAIAGVHVRRAVPTPIGLPAWLWAVVLFGWLTLIAAGPFIYLARRWQASLDRLYPQVGDQLWNLWACPWIIAAGVATVSHATDPGRLDQAYVGSLGLGLFLVTACSVPILAARWLWGGPIRTRLGSDDDPNWTQWVGLVLTATWPLQCGVGLVVMG